LSQAYLRGDWYITISFSPNAVTPAWPQNVIKDLIMIFDHNIASPALAADQASMSIDA